tara:strand:- start:153 stop:872 length:720 start_codon:yes stop_codon:yes gene_type:complete
LIKLNKKSKKLILLQRNELLSQRQKILRKRFGRFLFTNFFVHFFQNQKLDESVQNLFEKEYDIIKNFLPSNVSNILDIGCGLGILNIFLNRKYNSKAKFFLIDKNKIDLKIKYGFSENYESYNNLNETKKILLANNIINEQIFLKNAEENIDIGEKIDLVISLKSMAFHYPLENYLNLLKRVCTKNTEFIFDISTERYQINNLAKYFENIDIIYEEDSQHPLKRIHCKKFLPGPIKNAK